MEDSKNFSKKGKERINVQNERQSNQKYSIEIPLKKDIIGVLIKGLRKMRNYSQERLGLLLGVQKAQISRLENSGRNISLSSLIKIFWALKAKVSFRVELEKQKDILVLQEVFKEQSLDDEIKTSA